MSSQAAIDLESGQGTQAVPRAGVGGSESTVRAAQLVVSQAETPFASESMLGGSNIDHSQHNASDQSIQTGQSPSPAVAQIPVATNPTFDSGPHNTASDLESEDPHMIGDFDGSASEFWKLFREEAENHDEARINTLKEGMKSSLLFAGLFSAALTAFVVDSKQNLKPNPADETVYYLRQHSVILSQISVQLSSIAPQVVIPSTPPPPFPPFSPLASDVRVNIFWFMALAFSLIAALLAILVQQWVRKYMHVFKRYGDPLKCSRLRQYLYEGCEGWYMPRVAEAVPGFLHVSLFLFFAGLGNSLMNINTKVALITIVPIGVIGVLYILMTFVPIIFPQSPYQNSFTGIFWYLFPKRRFRDRGSKEMKPVDSNMATGQMQLAMEETKARMYRDKRAIRWLIDSLTEDAEMDKFLSAIPGSFNTDWGREVWKRVHLHDKSEDQSKDEPVADPHRDTTAHEPPSYPPNPHLPHSTTGTAHGREDVVHELGGRVAHSVEMCKNRNLFSDDDIWRKRTRACIEATASLVCCANAKFSWFGDISKLLGDICSHKPIQEMSSEGKNELFVARWTCLSLMAIQRILEDTQVQHHATQAIKWLEKADVTGNKDALAAAKKINEPLLKASACLLELEKALPKTEDLTKQEKDTLRSRAVQSQISELERINTEANRLDQVDGQILSMQNAIFSSSRHLTSQFPFLLDGADFDNKPRTPLKPRIPFTDLVELFNDRRKLPFQFPRPGKTLNLMCSPATTLRNIIKGRWDADAYKELLKNLKNFHTPSGWKGDEIQRLSWRLQDLSDGGRLGFTVELFFLTLSQPLSKSSSESKQPNSPLYTGTFRAITSDWREHKHSLGTQNLLLDIAISRHLEFDQDYPPYIVDEFLLLLGNIFEGQTGQHIDDAGKLFKSLKLNGPRKFGERVLRVLTRG